MAFRKDTLTQVRKTIQVVTKDIQSSNEKLKQLKQEKEQKEKAYLVWKKNIADSIKSAESKVEILNKTKNSLLSITNDFAMKGK